MPLKQIKEKGLTLNDIRNGVTKINPKEEFDENKMQKQKIFMSNHQSSLNA
jgi:hypothetical protein